MHDESIGTFLSLTDALRKKVFELRKRSDVYKSVDYGKCCIPYDFVYLSGLDGMRNSSVKNLIRI